MIRITQGTSWNKNVIAEGNTKTLSIFRNHITDGQTHESSVLLFFNDASNCKLKVRNLISKVYLILDFSGIEIGPKI